MKAKRKTLNAGDVLAAMEEMEFERFLEPLRDALEGKDTSTLRPPASRRVLSALIQTVPTRMMHQNTEIQIQQKNDSNTGNRSKMEITANLTNKTKSSRSLSGVWVRNSTYINMLHKNYGTTGMKTKGKTLQI